MTTIEEAMEQAKKGKPVKKAKKTPVAPATIDVTSVTVAPEVVQPATTPAPVPEVQAVAVQPSTTTPTAPTSAPPKPMSWKDKIAAAAKKVDAGAILAEVREANQVVTDPSMTRAFAEAILAGDALLIQQEGFADDDHQTRQRIHSLDYNYWKARLAKLGGASNILDLLASFEGSKVGVVDHLWQMVGQIVRPAMNCWNRHDLQDMAKKLASNGHLVAQVNIRVPPRDAVVFVGERNTIAYMPKTQLAKTGWPWITEVSSRVNSEAESQKMQLADRMEAFKRVKKSKVQISFEEVKSGTDGYVFVEVGRGQYRGAMLSIKGGVVSVIEAVGMQIPELPDNLRWDAKYDDWPDDAKDVYRALYAWRNVPYRRNPEQKPAEKEKAG